MRKPPYYTYYSKTRLFIHKLVTGKYFDVAISGVIGLNVITMSLEYYQMPQVSTGDPWSVKLEWCRRFK